MANVLLKSLKFTKILNGRLSFSYVKPYINGPCVVRSYKQTRQTKAYATAAYKLALNEDSVVKNRPSSNIKNELQSIDKALSDIDIGIRRSGRTQLKNVFEIFSSITDKEMTSSTHGLYLMRCCKYSYDEPPAKRIELVNQIWNKYQELGIPFDVSHYNALLDVHISNGFNFDPAEILVSMEDLNIEPNKVTYMLIMKKYCQDGNINGASEILEYMKEKGLPADEKVFNYLIEGHIKNKDFAGAQEMIEVMRSSNLELTADTHVILACGYAASGDKEKMLSCLKQCEVENSPQNVLKVIDVLATSGNHQHINDVLSLIPSVKGYEQDFINAFVELIHKGQIDTAYKLAVATVNPNYQEGYNIFIKQLIKVGRPVTEVIQFCEHIMKEGHKNIFLIASKTAADTGDLDYASPLFEKLLQYGFYIRPINFWPLINSVKEKKSAGAVWSVLKKMSDFGVPANFSTYYDVLYPALGVPKPNDIIQHVKDCGQTLQAAADALFMYYCNLGEIDNALHLTEIYDVQINNTFNVSGFLDKISQLSKENLRKYLKLLRYMFMEVDNSEMQSEIQGKLLAGLISRKTGIFEELLNRYEVLKFSPQALQVCEQEILHKMPARVPYIRKLKSMNLQRQNVFKEEYISVEEENKYFNYLKDHNMPCRPFLMKRLFYHTRTKNTVRVSELLALGDELRLEYSPILLSNLMTMYCNTMDLEKATMILNKIKTDFQTFKLDVARYLEYIIVLMRFGKFDESAEALKNYVKEAHSDVDKEYLFKSIRKLNMILSDVNDVEFIRKMQNLLLPLCMEAKSKKLCLENIIHYHLQRNNFSSAFEEFRNIILTHQMPVLLNPFLKKCISSDENEYLQKTIDLITNYVGKSTALLELAVAFIETSNVQKAVKLLEKLGRETDPRALENICMKLSSQNKLYELEQLINCTKSLPHIDIEKLYKIAFKTCVDRKDFDKAVDLLHALRQEVGEPKSETLKYLQDLFEKNNQPLLLNLVSKSSDTVPMATEYTKTFIGHLEAGNAEAALKELSSMKKGYIRLLSIKTLTDLVELCLQNNCVTDLSMNVQAMSYIIDNVKDVIKPLLEKYAKAGDIEKFTSISSFIPDFSLMNIGFNSYVTEAFLTSGRYEDLLSLLEERTDKKNKMFSVNAFEELLKMPEFEDRVCSLAEKYIESNYYLPMAVVWAHYFSKENFEKADKIYKKHPFFQPDRVDSFIIRKIKENESVTLAQKYLEFVTSLSVRQRVKERAYGAALDLFVLKGMHDEAVALVLESEKQNLLLHKYYLSSLVTLKNMLEKDNKPVPFSIPMDASSSSDSE